MARSNARSTPSKKPSMALMAFTSFSLLVAGSVALSNGSEVAPWQPAMAQDPQGPQRPAPAASNGADDAAQPAEASLFAAVADPEAIAASKNTSLVSLSHASSPTSDTAGAGNGAAGGGAGKAAVPPVTSAEHAPPVFKGELPVNTLIAPAQPVIVLKGGEFGWRVAPDDGRRELHNGTDISAPEGSPVVAALDGTVTAVFWDVWGGNRVEVSHANGMKTTYNHMSKVMVRVGDHLKASEQLGAVGHTGMRVTGPHLHFETWVNGKVVDPQSFDWKSGEEIIPASRPAYSNADQAAAQQPAADPNATTGVDAGPAPTPSKAPQKDRDAIVAAAAAAAPTAGSGEKKTDSKKAEPKKTEPTKTEPKKPASGQSTVEAGGTQKAAGTGGTGNTGKVTSGTAPRTGQTGQDKTTKDQGGSGGSGNGTGKKKQQPTTHTPSPSTTPTPSPTKDKAPVVPVEPVPGNPDPSPTKPAPTQPAPTGVDPRTADITLLTTPEQLKQRTQYILGSHLTLTAPEQAKAYVPGSALDLQLQALVGRAPAVGLPATDPYVAQLTAAQQAVAAAGKAPRDPKLAATATAQLRALQNIAITTPPFGSPVAGGK
ncbi:M23 family metallopeptidase [Kocuria sp.]|uniref:M23 family metallopeptidase n=1 Tax=Kocuria sp. TaxID=1871328 RepID=UPI0026DB08C3|nr:M23 family metallopeptidase [Kocuria sp.]MDO4918949.1 M23 family metallopeptidase [Kocuria sp.]